MTESLKFKGPKEKRSRAKDLANERLILKVAHHLSACSIPSKARTIIVIGLSRIHREVWPMVPLPQRDLCTSPKVY